MEDLKQQWVMAYTLTLHEYQNYVHKCDHKCAKCLVAGTEEGILYNCSKCLESLDDKRNRIACLFRNCPASSSIKATPTQTMRLIEYHKRAVKYLETVSPITFTKHPEVIHKHLKEIDKKVYDEIP